MEKLNKKLLYGFAGLNLLIILVGWYMGSHKHFVWNLADLTLVVGRLTGLLAVFFVLMQFVLIGREVWIEKLFGLDRLAKVHRLNGYLSMGLIVVHLVFLTISYAVSAKVPVWQQSMNFFQNYPDVGQAMFSFVLFIVVVVSSITIARKHYKYETWYFVHLITYLAVLLAWGHQLKNGGDFLFSNKWFINYWYLMYGFVLVNFAWYRFVRPLRNFAKYSFVVDQVVEETADSWSVYIKASKGGLDRFGIAPGQFMSVRFLQKGFWYQSHPFSLSMVPKDNCLRVTIKKLGDYTAKIAQLTKGTKVMVEGPFGLFKAQKGDKNKYLFVAGGVGITPIRALIEQVAVKNDVILLYCNRTLKEAILRKELGELSEQFHFTIYDILSAEPDFQGEKGYLDQDKVARLVKDVKDRQVYMCGPGPMMEIMKKTLVDDFALNKSQIHFDIFSL